MREFFGNPQNIVQPIVGVINTKPTWIPNKHQIYLFEKPFKKIFSRPKMLGSPDCFLIPEGLEGSLPSSLPVVTGIPVKICSAIEDGDVVQIEPTGKLTLLYDISSNDNAILVTNRCNCSCIMCPQPPRNDPEHIYEQTLFLISLMKDKEGRVLGITGGEPTILGDRLVRLIELCRKRLPNTLLTLLTNGRRLNDFEFTRNLASIGWPNLRFEIGLYADNDAEHDSIVGVGGSFYESIEGLHNLGLLGQPAGLRTVLHALTVERLVQFSEFVYRNLPFVFQVAFMGIETTGMAKDNLSFLWVDPFDYRDMLSVAVYHLHRRRIPVSIYNLQLCLLPPDLWRFARRSISDWKETYLPLCEDCFVKNRCCGIFGTGERNSLHINPVLEKEVPLEWRSLIE